MVGNVRTGEVVVRSDWEDEGWDLKVKAVPSNNDDSAVMAGDSKGHVASIVKSASWPGNKGHSILRRETEAAVLAWMKVVPQSQSLELRALQPLAGWPRIHVLPRRMELRDRPKQEIERMPKTDEGVQMAAVVHAAVLPSVLPSVRDDSTKLEVRNVRVALR